MTTTARAAAARTPAGDGVHATARVHAAFNGRVTTLPRLRSDGPFHLRRLRSHGARARVCVIGAMSAPLGGDRLAIDVTAEDHADVCVTTAAATIALRGPTTGHATYDVTLSVGDHGTVWWLPQPLISTRDSNLRQTCAVDLAPTARLVLREEQVLGRAGEPPGRLSTRLTVTRAGRPLLDQHNSYGPAAPGWDGPAVLGGHRVTGQLLIVDPRFAASPPSPRLLGDDRAEGRGTLVPLAGPAALVTVVAPTPARLRAMLDTAARPLTGPLTT
ncbi:urease accessory protein UreD [Streptomyces sp. HMX112]|uniref:urease accessory protein UreD n=1 Tax=Streptomyces sp. HMX112 TaxID=3390850 RepID=UPI003A80823F